MPRCARISDDFPSLFLGVEQAIRAEFGELGEGFALHAKALVFAEMPVEDVELHRSHAV